MIKLLKSGVKNTVYLNRQEDIGLKRKMKQNIKNLPKIGQIIFSKDTDSEPYRYVVLPSYFANRPREYTLWCIHEDNLTMSKSGSALSIEEAIEWLSFAWTHMIFIGEITTDTVFHNPRFIND